MPYESWYILPARGIGPLMTIKTLSKHIVCLGFGALILTGCGVFSVEEAEPLVTDQDDRIRAKSGTIHGNDKGFVLYNTRDDEETANAAANGDVGAASGNVEAALNGGPVGANPYLWQASLESLDFLPLLQADSSGGVIISDWYAPPETPEERFKITVFIRDRALRADAVKVAVFRQTSEGDGWVDAEVDPSTATGLEDNILKRARELRLASAG